HGAAQGLLLRQGTSARDLLLVHRVMGWIRFDRTVRWIHGDLVSWVALDLLDFCCPRCTLAVFDPWYPVASGQPWRGRARLPIRLCRCCRLPTIASYAQ